MRLPWSKRVEERAEDARRRAEAAERELWKVRAQWPETLRIAGVTRGHRQANGWTETIKTIFGGHE